MTTRSFSYRDRDNLINHEGREDHEELHLPLRDLIFLWTLVFLLIILSTIEFINERKGQR
jgi:hypothetical protein